MSAVDLWKAAAAGQDDEVREALTTSPELINQRSRDGWTALHLAAYFGKASTAALLLDRGADMLVPSENHEANLPINAAAAGQRLEVVRLLVARGCPADARASSSGYTALHLAAHEGNDDLVSFLLDAGADPSLATGDGLTASDLARRAGHQRIVAKLAR